MNHFLNIFAVTALLMIFPAYAQEDADAVLAEQEEVIQDAPIQNAPIKALGEDDDYEARLELSRQMHEIWPIRTKMEGALDTVSEQVPQQERLKFKAGMRKAIQFEALEEASIDAMADIFTSAELEAMIAFYGSKEGRAVSHKTSDYERALQPTLVKMIDKALLDVKLGSQ